LRAERVPAERVCFRTEPRFETASPAEAWLHCRPVVARGENHPDSVPARVFAVSRCINKKRRDG
jgi:hypothetical protein